MNDYLSFSIEDFGKVNPASRSSKEYYCHCNGKKEAKDSDITNSPNITETDDEGICVDCGYYAFKKIYGVHL